MNPIKVWDILHEKTGCINLIGLFKTERKPYVELTFQYV